MITVGDVRWESDEARPRVVAMVRGAGEPFELWFRFPEGTPPPPTPGDAFLSAILKPAMHLRLPLHVDAPCDRELLRAANEDIQPIYRFWVPSLAAVEATCSESVATAAAAAAASRAVPAGVGVFFSGGVDSLYSLIRFREETTHLVPVHGFDVPIDDVARWDRVRADVGRIADRFGIPVLDVATNLRELSDRIATWPLYHGGALAAVAHATGGVLSRIRIGSTHTYDEPFPWGSHPLLDHHWSSAAVDVRHDGAGATRFRKIELVAEDPVALETLRVCYKNREGTLNCGRCAKCVRTMISLAILGRLEACGAFEARLDERAVASLPIDDENERSFARENLAAARERGAEPWLVRGLERAIARSRSASRHLTPRVLVRRVYGRLPVAARHRIRRLLGR